MAEYTEILYEKQRKGVLITLNRPEAMNAISRTLIKELHEALDEAVADPEIRAIVLTGAINGWALGAGSWLALFTHITIASEHAVFAQPEVRHGSNTSFMWTLLAGFKNSLRYGLTGDHIDAYEALRIGIVNKVVPQDQLLEECFHIVERIALVPPETVKINLSIATMGLEMMGLRDALLLDSQLSAPAHVMLREEFRRPLDEARQKEGIRSYLKLRDGPFQPEPFGPRSQKKD